ncbi:DNA polymerase/3'-5' exonuclease PolX [Deinococcus sp. Marseille-Q6407]|uniref:DNA polymerase/3'-5' exonuclease PolX n=1 Tax=Deinococcus sp. Marseille-Q6407 TaxID=2969223 RepID=UPI0021BDFEA5|nr:DNA polymerase/3'-5' exonuclease PolX [Deinococcus sp. Marseille-Q6407]
MADVTRKDLVHALNSAADLLDVLGSDEGGFRAAAYRNAARNLDRSETSLDELRETRFAGVPKVGKGIAAELMGYLDSGRFAPLDEAAEQIPEGVQSLFAVRGLGPKKVRALWDAGIDSLPRLRGAAQSGELAAVKGFGAKGAQALGQAAQFVLDSQDRFLLSQGLLAGEGVQQALAGAGLEAQFSGDLGRLRDTLPGADLDLTGDPAAWASALAGTEGWEAGESSAETLSGRFGSVPVTLHRAAAGSPAFRPFDEPEHAGLDLPDPAELIQTHDIRGMLHTHTVWSDGVSTLREMVDSVLALGHEYLGTGDHSQSAAYAGGMTPERLREYIAEIRGLQAEGLPILAGAEVDILADGSLDYDDELLAELDYVVASVHSAFGLSQADQTERLVRAASHPLVSILGHPTGRLLLRREGYAVDIDAVLDACAAGNTAAEINANPWRLDLRWQDALRWRSRVRFSINTDAHSPRGLRDVRYGVMMAQKAGLTPADVVNCLERDAFKAWARG